MLTRSPLEEAVHEFLSIATRPKAWAYHTKSEEFSKEGVVQDIY